MRKELKLLSDQSLEMVSGGSVKNCLRAAVCSVLGTAAVAEGYVILSDLSEEDDELRRVRGSRSAKLYGFSSKLRPGIERVVNATGSTALDLHNDLIDAIRRKPAVVAGSNQAVAQ